MMSIEFPKRLILDPVSKMNSGLRWKTDDESDSEKNFNVIDPNDKRVWGFLVIDNTLRGPALGGIRIAKDLTANEISRLARVMTYKNAAAMLPFGGGKSGLCFDPLILDREHDLKIDLMSLFAEALVSENNYVPAPDMGTNEQDMQCIHNLHMSQPNPFQSPCGLPVYLGGVPIDDWALTAHSVYAAICSLEKEEPSFILEGSKIIIQGFGNVGSPLAKKLVESGAFIVGLSDIDTGLWNSSGLDMKELALIRQNGDGLNTYKGKTEKRFEKKQTDWLLEAPADILIPAARPDAITAKNADRINVSKIFQAANTPSSKMTEYYLKNRRGIDSYSDFIVNAGGVIGCAVEHKMRNDESYKNRVLSLGDGGRNHVEKLIEEIIAQNLRDIKSEQERSPRGDLIFREAALGIANKRLKETDMVAV